MIILLRQANVRIDAASNAVKNFTPIRDAFFYEAKLAAACLDGGLSISFQIDIQYELNTLSLRRIWPKSSTQYRARKEL